MAPFFFFAPSQATKGKTVKKNTLNYEVLDYTKPAHPQMMEQIGRGNRLTSGKFCGQPATAEENVRFFEALEKEKEVEVTGKAAQKRKKNPLAGDAALIEAYETQKRGEMIVKLKFARARELKGEATPTDVKLFNSRLVKAFDKEQEAPVAGAAVTTQAPQPKKRKPSAAPSKSNKKAKKSKQDAEEDSDTSDSDSDEEMFEVDHIVSGPDSKGRFEVKWKGYASDENTFEKRSNFHDKTLVPAFLEAKCNDSSSEDDDTPLAQILATGSSSANGDDAPIS